MSLALAGCIGYVYPSLSVTPPVQVGPAACEVRAFRVDVKDDLNHLDVGENDRYELKEVSFLFGDRLFPQMKLAIDYGWYANFIALSYSQHTHYTMMVRLYRPGWRTVEVGPWGLPGNVEWQKAADVATQEQAVDDLVTTWDSDSEAHLQVHGLSAATDVSKFRCLSRGSASAAHRESLLYAASEYDRVAALLFPEGTDEEVRVRLAEKAKALRELAGK